MSDIDEAPECPRCGSKNENKRVDLNILCDGEIVERLTFKKGESFEAEVHCDDYAIEVINIE